MTKKTVVNKTPKQFWVPGQNYFIRTVTHFHTGELVREEENSYILVKAAWIADTGRFSTFLENGQPNEVEPYPEALEVSVSKGALVDACKWPHALPRAQK